MAIIPQMARTYILPPLPLRDVGLFADVIPTVNTVFDGANRASFGGHVWGPTVDGVLIPEGFTCNTVFDLEPDTITLERSDINEPWTVNAGITCSTVPLDEGPSLAEMTLDEVRKSLSASLAYAATSPTPTFFNLSDYDVPAGAGATMGETMALVEGALATAIGNRRGYILMSVAHLAAAMDASAVVDVLGTLRTPSGHLVVADAGVPTGIVYGTGRIGYSMSDARLIDQNGALDITRNTVTFLVQAEGLVLFDTETVVSATLSEA